MDLWCNKLPQRIPQDRSGVLHFSIMCADKLLELGLPWSQDWLFCPLNGPFNSNILLMQRNPLTLFSTSSSTWTSFQLLENSRSTSKIRCAQQMIVGIVPANHGLESPVDPWRSSSNPYPTATLAPRWLSHTHAQHPEAAIDPCLPPLALDGEVAIVTGVSRGIG
jgi:hypothetical protein